MRFAARIFITLLEKFPRFEVSAYLLVIVIGLKLLADWGVNSDWSFAEPKWLKAHMGSWQQSFEKVENWRRDRVHDYEHWLQESWPLGLEKHDPPPVPPEPAPGEEPQEVLHDALHVPHLLNFHSPRRPEFILFWSTMVICFFVGFIPKRKAEPHGDPATK